jgi:mycothiol synthase
VPSDLPPLPDGYRSRPAVLDDAVDIHCLIATGEVVVDGRAETDPAAVAADLLLPGVDLALDTLVVHGPDGGLAGRAWLNPGRRCEVDVHPGHTGRGLGTSLLAWAQARARERGQGSLAQTVSDRDAAGTTLLRSHGYGPMATAWLLEISGPQEPSVPEPPPGVTVRPFQPGQDDRAVYGVVQDAFDDWQQRRKSYEEWGPLTIERDSFAPWASPVALAGGELVGTLIAMDVPGSDEGYVDQLAVRTDQRGLGVARLLLSHSFRAFHRSGRHTTTLWTHSGTGALALYERVGMSVRRSSTVFNRALDAS